VENGHEGQGAETENSVQPHWNPLPWAHFREVKGTRASGVGTENWWFSRTGTLCLGHTLGTRTHVTYAGPCLPETPPRPQSQTRPGGARTGSPQQS
jgi:hypothetical protein